MRLLSKCEHPEKFIPTLGYEFCQGTLPGYQGSKNPAYYAMFLGNCKGCLSRYGKNVGNELYY